MKSYFYTVFLLSLSLTLNAQIFVKSDAVGLNDGTSWQNAYTNLQIALDAASPEDQIWVAAGTYTPSGPTPDSSHFLIQTPVEIYGGFNGTEIQLDQRNWELNVTLLDGDKKGDDIPGNFQANRSDNAHHIVLIESPDGGVTLDGFRFKGGMTRIDDYDSNFSFFLWRGGAMYAHTSTIVRNCHFEDNAGWQGAGIYARAQNTPNQHFVVDNCTTVKNFTIIGGGLYISYAESLQIDGCKFIENTTNGSGAGIVIGNLSGNISNSVFKHNSATSSASGISIFHNSASPYDSSIVAIIKCEFDSNSSLGGAVYLNNLINSPKYIIDSCNFNGNTAIEGSGGAIYGITRILGSASASSGLIEIKNSTFQNNTGKFGGSVRLQAFDDTLTLRMDNCHFQSNYSSTVGGCINMGCTPDGTVNAFIANSTFIENEALEMGGALGIFNNNSVAPLTYNIERCSFQKNRTDGLGGAITTGNYLVGAKGNVRESQFIENESLQNAGAIYSVSENLIIDDCHFEGNHTNATNPGFNGGGAIGFWLTYSAKVTNCYFDDNSSDDEAGAIEITGEANVDFEGSVFTNNKGGSTIWNEGTLNLLNVTLQNNDFGIAQFETSSLTSQNSIFNNAGSNLIEAGKNTIISNGSNISSDATMAAYLTGNGNFEDFNEKDPLLDENLTPLSESPCIDKGNPAGVTTNIDLYGNPRIQGSQIDIGAIESPFTSSIKNVLWEDQAMNLFPNPCKDVAFITHDQLREGPITIEVYSQLGIGLKNISRDHAGGYFHTNVRLDNLAPGVYYLILSDQEKKYGVKFYCVE